MRHSRLLSGALIRWSPGGAPVSQSLKPSVSDVLALSESYLEPIIELTTRLTQLPAPTNDEAVRAVGLSDELEALGYDNVAIDDIHDVTARIKGEDSSKVLLVAAHIDTVFPRDTDLTVRREEDTLHAPAIGD